jgi:hypothetical protein
MADTHFHHATEMWAASVSSVGISRSRNVSLPCLIISLPQTYFVRDSRLHRLDSLARLGRIGRTLKKPKVNRSTDVRATDRTSLLAPPITHDLFSLCRPPTADHGRMLPFISPSLCFFGNLSRLYLNTRSNPIHPPP